MSLLTKAIVTILAFSAIVYLIANLPLVSQYPLPDAFSTGLSIIFAYYFAWSSVFTCLTVLWYWAIFMMGFELAVVLFKLVLRVAAWTIRILA